MKKSEKHASSLIKRTIVLHYNFPSSLH